MPIPTATAPTSGPNPVAQLAIVLFDNGSIAVNGPIDNKLLALGLLEIAKDTVIKHCDKADKRIVEPPPGMAGMLGGK